MIHDDSEIDGLKGLINLFTIGTDQLIKIKQDFRNELISSLTDGNKRMLKCLPTFVSKPPTGQETGDFFLIDLGGTHLRVGYGNLLGQNHYEVKRESIIIPEGIKKGSGFSLFEFIAQHMISFATMIKGDSLDTSKIGFTFSFPVEQESLTHGRLIQFNKAFDCHDIVGLDMVQLLQSALDQIRPGFLQVGCLVNDTVGTLAAHAYKNPDTKMAVILGTGTNAAYNEPTKGMVINIEWGGFGDNIGAGENFLPVTKYDEELDRMSENSGRQTFEKMVSGMYLGEIFRLGTKKWLHEYAQYEITTKMLHDISELVKEGISAEVIAVLQVLADRIISRSASLSAALISAVYEHAAKPHEKFVVAIDGSLYTKNKAYPGLLDGALCLLNRPGNLLVESSHGEPLIGPAIIIASHL